MLTLRELHGENLKQIIEQAEKKKQVARGGEMINSCYNCSHYYTCFLRIGIDNLLDEGHHKQICGGKSVLKSSVPLPFFELLAKICKRKSYSEED